MNSPNWVDPYADMTDEEFDEHVEELFSTRPRAVAVSLRMAPDLLERVKRQAGRAGMPYQTFVKSVLETAVARLERVTTPTMASAASRTARSSGRRHPSRRTPSSK